MAIAVLDVGKTNAKAILLDEAGGVLAQRSRPCAVLPGPPYPQLDLDGTWAWAVSVLGEFAALAPVDSIVPVTHGAAGVLMAGDRPALPALDYEHPGPEETARELEGLLDPFALTASPVLPLGMCLGAQLLWQQRSFPDAFARASEFLLLPQYWAWRLSGVKATEVTSLGAHTHLWRPGERRFSGLVERCGWAGLFPPMRRAWEPLGPVTPELAAATGLPPDCRVLAGIHDSNASWLPHLVAREPPFTVLSTGTWVIAMAAGAALDRLDPAADMLANVDARGDPVPTARFMGGRELELVAGADGLQAEATPTDVMAVIATGAMALPAFVAGSGPFLGRRGEILGDPGPQPRPTRGAGCPLRRAGGRRDARPSGGRRADRGRGRLPAQRRLLRAARCVAARTIGPRHQRSERHCPRGLAPGAMERPAALAQLAARALLTLAGRRSRTLPCALARSERRRSAGLIA